jgi:serine protease
VVVRFASGRDAAARQRTLDAHRLTLVQAMPGTDFVLVRPSRHLDPTTLKADPAIADARPVAAVHAFGTGGSAPGSPPDDELFPAQWHLRAIGIPRAWEVTTGTGAVVAVLDTGVAYEDDGPYKRAPDLAGTTFVPGWDFVDNDAHPDDVPIVGKGSHGTHIAGTVAETTNNRIGAAGAAPGASIMPVRVLAPDETGTSWATAQGLRFAADHGANVANLSLGGAVDAPELADAVAYAIGKGVTVVVSSGDDGSPALTYPAAYPGVVAVGAVRYDNTRASYSNYGADLALVAPGGDVHEDLNQDGLDDGVVQQTLNERPGSFCYCFTEGTSSAAAHVSSVAALVLAAGRARSPAEVRDVLVSTAADLGPPGRDDEYGAGLVQATGALGMAPLPGEVPPTSAVRDEAGTATPDAAGPSTPGATSPLFGTPSRDPSSGRGAAAWLRHRWVGLAVLAALAVAVVAGRGLGRRRRQPSNVAGPGG